MADPTNVDRAIADMLAYDGPGKRYTEADAEQFRKACAEGLCEPWFDEDEGRWTFEATDAGHEILAAGGSVAGRAAIGAKLN